MVLHWVIQIYFPRIGRLTKEDFKRPKKIKPPFEFRLKFLVQSIFLLNSVDKTHDAAHWSKRPVKVSGNTILPICGEETTPHRASWGKRWMKSTWLSLLFIPQNVRKYLNIKIKRESSISLKKTIHKFSHDSVWTSYKHSTN